MKKIFDLHLDKPYSLIGSSQVKRFRNDDGVDCIERGYVCNNCGSTFQVTHRPVFRQSAYYWAWNDYEIYCPCCGRKHIFCDSSWYDGNQTVIIGEKQTAPLKMHIQVWELKEKVVLSDTLDGVRLHWNETYSRYESSRVHYIEKFTFDVKNRRTTYQERRGNWVSFETEFGQPFKSEVLNRSVFQYVRKNSMLRGEKHSANMLIKVVREAIAKKFKKLHGHAIQSMYVATKAESWLTAPLHNMAYRLACPEMPNLTYSPYQVYSIETANAPAMERLGITKEMLEQANDIEKFRSGIGVKSILVGVNAPTTGAIQKLVYSYGFRFIPVLKRIVAVTNDINYICRIWEIIRKREKTANGYSGEDDTEIILNSLRVISRIKPVGATVTFLERYCKEHPDYLYELQDITRMLGRVANENLYHLNGVRIGNLHDALVEIINQQNETGFNMDVPKAVQQQLQLTDGGMSFEVPSHSLELVKASSYFHNCVRTYADSVKEGRCYIVVMTDSAGTPVACLEVRNKRLVQAKLKYNKSVSRDKDINDEIVKWCQEVNLTIDTQDVNYGQSTIAV